MFSQQSLKELKDAESTNKDKPVDTLPSTELQGTHIGRCHIQKTQSH